MAVSEDEQSEMELKLFVDRKNNRLLFAEAGNGFVDTLFSFLTLPLGTFVKLVGKPSHSEAVAIGCLGNLHKSVADLDAKHFCLNWCKEMLLRPINSSEAECRKLKLDVADHSEPTKYFICQNCQQSHWDRLVSISKDAKCCGHEFIETLQLNVSGNMNEVFSKDDGVFVKRIALFIVTDDLKVMPIHPGGVIELLNEYGIDDMNLIEERTEKIGLKEVLDLLKCSLLSNAPLTDLFLKMRRGFDLDLITPLTRREVKVEEADGSDQKAEIANNHDKKKAEIANNHDKKMAVKVTVNKLNKKVLFTESQENFVDFLFTFLAIPLGQMLHILDGQSSLGCINNLYKSVIALDSNKYFKSEECKNRLLTPLIAPQFEIKNQLLPISKAKRLTDRRRSFTTYETLNHNGFVSGPVVFMVTDDLVVTPFSTGSAISFITGNKMSLRLSDLEQVTVSVGAVEAINIFRASLNSTSALTNGLLNLIPK